MHGSGIMHKKSADDERARLGSWNEKAMVMHLTFRIPLKQWYIIFT